MYLLVDYFVSQIIIKFCAIVSKVFTKHCNSPAHLFNNSKTNYCEQEHTNLYYCANSSLVYSMETIDCILKYSIAINKRNDHDPKAVSADGTAHATKTVHYRSSILHSHLFAAGFQRNIVLKEGGKMVRFGVKLTTRKRKK